MILQIFITTLIAAFIFYLVSLVSMDKVSLKDTISWFLISFLILPLVWFPAILEIFTHLLGFQISSNLVLFVSICLLIYLNFSLTKSRSLQDKQMRRLTQRLALLEKRYEKD